MLTHQQVSKKKTYEVSLKNSPNHCSFADKKKNLKKNGNYTGLDLQNDQAISVLNAGVLGNRNSSLSQLSKKISKTVLNNQSKTDFRTFCYKWCKDVKLYIANRENMTKLETFRGSITRRKTKSSSIWSRCCLYRWSGLWSVAVQGSWTNGRRLCPRLHESMAWSTKYRSENEEWLGSTCDIGISAVDASDPALIMIAATEAPGLETIFQPRPVRQSRKTPGGPGKNWIDWGRPQEWKNSPDVEIEAVHGVKCISYWSLYPF